jgi:hypothetical protein
MFSNQEKFKRFLFKLGKFSKLENCFVEKKKAFEERIFFQNYSFESFPLRQRLLSFSLSLLEKLS